MKLDPDTQRIAEEFLAFKDKAFELLESNEEAKGLVLTVIEAARAMFKIAPVTFLYSEIEDKASKTLGEILAVIALYEELKRRTYVQD